MFDTTVWVVGKYVTSFKAGIVWDVIAVCSTEEIALSAAEGHEDYFIGPLFMDNPLPDQREDWVGAYYPAYR